MGDGARGSTVKKNGAPRGRAARALLGVAAVASVAACDAFSGGEARNDGLVGKPPIAEDGGAKTDGAGAGGSGGSAGAASDGAVDTSRFLAPCKDDSECGGLACLCGMCTWGCGEGSDYRFGDPYGAGACGKLGPDVACRFQAMYFPGCETSQQKLCTLRCETDTDCGAPGIVCRDAACVSRDVSRDAFEADMISCAPAKEALIAPIEAAKACEVDADCVGVTGTAGVAFGECDHRLVIDRSQSLSSADALATAVGAACRPTRSLVRGTPCSWERPRCEGGSCEPTYAMKCPGDRPIQWLGDCDNDCIASACGSCGVAFWSDSGVYDVSRCVGRTRCGDRGDCYRPETCMWFIDLAGGPFSAAADEGIRWGSCLAEAGCGADCAARVETGS